MASSSLRTICCLERTPHKAFIALKNNADSICKLSTIKTGLARVLPSPALFSFQLIQFVLNICGIIQPPPDLFFQPVEIKFVLRMTWIVNNIQKIEIFLCTPDILWRCVSFTSNQFGSALILLECAIHIQQMYPLAAKIIRIQHLSLPRQGNVLQPLFRSQENTINVCYMRVNDTDSIDIELVGVSVLPGKNTLNDFVKWHLPAQPPGAKPCIARGQALP